jgi:hypothetical protein
MEANLKIASLLLKKGANLQVKSKEGKSPLDFVPSNHRNILLESVDNEESE